MHAQRDTACESTELWRYINLSIIIIISPVLSVCPSVQYWYSVKTNAHIVTLFFFKYLQEHHRSF